MSATLDFLARVPLFKHLPRKTLQRLERIAVARQYNAGDDIVQEGDRGAGFFLITEGRVEVLKGGSQLNTLGAGEFFGEMALLDNHPRVATVRALEDTSCLALSRWDFVAELRANPDLAIEMLEAVSARLRQLEERITA
ncbi:MAG TPA: cyclic nucleotide-binding domain-containing protein [Dehalococcoidia bacterium]|nr:cyclic nucleotide-binding domain-containing protein [Dehalococcoidia bacterium]